MVDLAHLNIPPSAQYEQYHLGSNENPSERALRSQKMPLTVLRMQPYEFARIAFALDQLNVDLPPNRQCRDPWPRKPRERAEIQVVYALRNLPGHQHHHGSRENLLYE